MLPSNVDPRRADRIVRQKPTMNANGQGEDLTPDYMNILGQRATTANATAETSSNDRHMVDGNSTGNIGIGGQTTNESHNINQLHNNSNNNNNNSVGEEVDSTTNVIPTSPQYGVAIIPNQPPIITTAASDITTETVTIPTDTITDTQVKQVTDDGKDIHSTPSRNDRFKVVKIASLEPFKRGRWKCMDYVDEAPPAVALQQQPPPPTSQQQQQQQQQQNKVTQSTGNIALAGGIYLQTQSLPQQQIQQMLLQSGYTNGTQFYPNVPTQMLPQTQYFYPTGTNLQTTQTLPQQLINTGGVPTSNIPTQFINTNQPYFTGVVPNSVGYPIPTNYQNLQYVPANVMQQQNQNSAFVPTSQTNVQLPTNFQQNQTYAGQPNVNQQPLVNGHAYPTQNDQQPPPPPQQQQQQNTTSLPAQAAKNVILNNIQQQPVVSQSQITQPNIQTNQIPVVQNSAQPQTVPVIQPQQNQVFQQQPQQQQTNFQQVPPQQPPPQQQQQQQQQVISGTTQAVATSQPYDQANNVYTNPQFDTNVNSLTVLENAEQAIETVNNSNNNNNNNETNTVDAIENPDDPSKTNPVVNAIDNKIEQAMDLVKSHLMYTVREEVEVLKEKIAELMERIQQLETENNFLRSQIPKSQTIPPSGGGGGIQQQQPAPSVSQTLQQQSSSSTPSVPTNLPTETNPPPPQ